MKAIALILSLLLCSMTVVAQGGPANSVPSWILGNWKFIGYIYHDSFNPPLNPDLELIFRYSADGTDDLYWDRKGETGFCERHGNFSVAGNTYNDEVTWTNPKNNIDCAQDPDMQVGKKTSTNIQIVKGQLQLNLGLAGEPFIYVFEATPNYPGEQK